MPEQLSFAESTDNEMSPPNLNTLGEYKPRASKQERKEAAMRAQKIMRPWWTANDGEIRVKLRIQLKRANQEMVDKLKRIINRRK